MTALVISTDAPAVAGPPQGHWTYADWEALPDDGNRYEIIDYRLDALGRYEYPRTFGEGQTITFYCLPTLPLMIAELFSGAPDTTL